MDFISTVINSIEKCGTYTLGDIKFQREDNGISLQFIKKEPLPDTLLTGLSDDLLQRANPPEIDLKRIVTKPVTIWEENEKSFTLFCVGDLQLCVNVLIECCDKVQHIYDESASHITRMFGSYVLILKVDGQLKAVYATPSPIRYCPLMYKLLEEIGGETAGRLLTALKNGETQTYQKLLLSLINDVVIADGGFDDNRPLNSCERNVLFGASEIMSDAMQNGMLDASVIVSNNLGTVITSSPETTQGVVKRMTGLFYTTTSPAVVKSAFEENVMPVYPYTGKIDQIEGLKHAVKMGYQKISVSVAAKDNHQLKQISAFENDDLTIYKFALCATGIDDETARIMANHADVVWSCASKPVREIVAPNALAQIGIKIPVFIMSQRGWELVTPRIQSIDPSFAVDKVQLNKGEDMPIIYNNAAGLSLMPYKQLEQKCVDCPSPCI